MTQRVSLTSLPVARVGPHVVGTGHTISFRCGSYRHSFDCAETLADTARIEELGVRTQTANTHLHSGGSVKAAIKAVINCGINLDTQTHTHTHTGNKNSLPSYEYVCDPF